MSHDDAMSYALGFWKGWEGFFTFWLPMGLGFCASCYFQHKARTKAAQSGKNQA